jgi:hypothetical protein
VTALFSDNIDQNLQILRELLHDIRPEERKKARQAAAAIEKAVVAIIKSAPHDPVVGLGVTFAIHVIAERLVQQNIHGDPGPGSNLIQLIN